MVAQSVMLAERGVYNNRRLMKLNRLSLNRFKEMRTTHHGTKSPNKTGLFRDIRIDAGVNPVRLEILNNRAYGLS